LIVKGLPPNVRYRSDGRQTPKYDGVISVKNNILLFTILTFLIINCSHTQTLITPCGKEVKVKCQPVYGNWCGKGYPAYEVTDYMPEPVDVWDEACKEHDLCYDKHGNYRNTTEKECDELLTQKFELLDLQGIPAPHQIINAYNYFKKNKPYRNMVISSKDLWIANTISCKGNEGIPTVFCDVGRGRDNCEITMGSKVQGTPCFCDYPPTASPFGFIPGGRYWGISKTANEF
jgi:hypothetical protein